jgi:hypothetical protein
MKNITKTRQRELLHGNVQKPNLRVQLHHGGEFLSSPLIVQSRQLSGNGSPVSMPQCNRAQLIKPRPKLLHQCTQS